MSGKAVAILPQGAADGSIQAAAHFAEKLVEFFNS
jgi:hypothetical protein